VVFGDDNCEGFVGRSQRMSILSSIEVRRILRGLEEEATWGYILRPARGSRPARWVSGRAEM